MSRYILFPGLIVLHVLCATPAFSVDTEQLIRDGIAHYDQGEFELARELLEQAVDQDPNNGFAAYELALTHQAVGDHKACIKTAKRSLRKIRKDAEQRHLLPQLSMLQASCHSASGDTKKAIKVFRAALEQNPEHYGLNFNIAISLLKEGDYDVAISHLENAVRADPSHPSPYYILGRAYEDLGRTVEGLLANLTFLQREYNTSRSAEAARAVVDIAYSRVQPNASGSGSTIILDPSAIGDSSDIATLTFTLVIAAAASTVDGKIKEPAVKSIAELLERFISIGATMDLDSDPESFFASYLLPDVWGLDDAGVTLAFAYFVLSSSGASEASAWLEAHPQETDALTQYFEIRANIQ